MDIEFNPMSWRRAGADVVGLSSGVCSAVDSASAGTTDAAACGAAKGLSTVDGAIVVALQALQSVLTEISDGFREAITAEGEAMIATGDNYATTEETNAEAGNQITLDL